MSFTGTYKACRLCPRLCGKPRDPLGGAGVCHMGGLPRVARAALHHWEEPCISGTRGSGTVFFSGCPLGCVFCQNGAISQGGFGEAVAPEGLARLFAVLVEQGAHNINLVSPTPYVPAILAALAIYRPRVPVVYNTGGYERLETLKLLSGWVDIYLPDLKYMDSQAAARYSGAPDYPEVAQRAIAEMARQTGPAQYDDNGLMLRGTLVRHLILPGHTGGAMRALNWVKESLPEGTPVSLMAQYTPQSRNAGDPLLGRALTRREHQRVLDHLAAIGLATGYVQALSSASTAYIPDFDLTGVKAP